MVRQMANTRRKMAPNIEKQYMKKMMRWSMNAKGVCPGESRQVYMVCCSEFLGMGWQ